MNKPYHTRYGRLGAALLLLIIAFIVHSCRKDHITDVEQAAAVNIEKFKIEYNKGIRPSLNVMDAQPGQAVLNLIHGLNVNWTKYTITRRADSSTVNEFEMMPDSAFFFPEHLSPGDTVKYNNKTSVVFIESAKGNVNFL